MLSKTARQAILDNTAPPTVVLGQPDPDGGLEPAAVEQVMRSNVQKLQTCYVTQLRQAPKLAGQLMVQFFISPAGSVPSAVAVGMDRTMASCIGDAIKTLQFPKPKGGREVRVNYPITFKPGEPALPAVDDTLGDATPGGMVNAAPPTAGSLDGATIDRYLKRSIRQVRGCYEKQLAGDPKLAGKVKVRLTIAPDGSVTSSSATGLTPEVDTCVAAVVKTIAFPRSAAVSTATYPIMFVSGDSPSRARPTSSPSPAPTPAVPTHHPGDRNPLAPLEAGLVECFRAQQKPYGVMVVDLAYDATGAVTTATPHGIDGDAFKACVTTVGKQAKRIDPATASERCSIAFGVMPREDAPAIDLTRDAITWNKHVIADAALSDAITAHVKAASTAADAVAIGGPIVIRPFDTTPMKLVDRVVATATAAGGNFVLAAQDGAGWRLLRPLELPVVPVATGTGGSWNSFVSPRVPTDPDRVSLTILLQPAQIWLGTSADDFIKVPAREWSTLEQKLATLKSSPELAKRTDVEIAGEDTVTYTDIVHVIDLATSVGFTRWTLVDPRSASTQPPP